MTLARDLHLGRLLGAGRAPRGAHARGVRVYTSDQTHFSIARALDLLGFPPETLVVVPSDERFRLHGRPSPRPSPATGPPASTPFAIAAVAGSTNTGSVDLVGELADVAAAEDLWLHVDAAYGGGARLSARDRDRVPDLERADSVTVDPHKWFFQAYDIGGLLVRDGAHLARCSAAARPSTTAAARRPAAGTADADDHDDHGDQLNFYKLSFEGTRRWRALKLWMSWKHLGTRGSAGSSRPTTTSPRSSPGAAPSPTTSRPIPATPELSVVCFRHLPGGRDAAMAMAPEALDAHQDRLQAALEASGDGWLTTTRLRGATWLRAGIVNYLSTEADIDRLLATLRGASPRTT